MADALLIGLNYRGFPGVWRPARAEIAFATTHGFASIQFHGLTSPGGLGADHLVRRRQQLDRRYARPG